MVATSVSATVGSLLRNEVFEPCFIEAVLPTIFIDFAEYDCAGVANDCEFVGNKQIMRGNAWVLILLIALVLPTTVSARVDTSLRDDGVTVQGVDILCLGCVTTHSFARQS